MAILPGSLDYLYYNGILDHIPVEAYATTPMTASGMAQMSGKGMGFEQPQVNATQYLQQAQKGYLYNTYTNPDTFAYRDSNPGGVAAGYSIKSAYKNSDGYGNGMGVGLSPYDNGEKSFREKISEVASKTKESVTNSPNWVKGLAAGGIMVATLYCLFKTGKRPVPHAPEPTFAEKVKSIIKNLKK